MKSETPSKKRGLKIILWIIGVVFALAFIGSLGSKSESAPQPSTQPATATEPSAPKTWHKVAELSGTTNKRGDVFKIDGTKQRITYTINGEYSPFLSVYLMPEGKNLERDGGFPEVSMAKVSGETLMYKSAGSYYIDVSAYGEWSVVIEEWR